MSPPQESRCPRPVNPLPVCPTRHGDALEDDDLLMAASHALIARDLLAGVTRLEGVAEMIARQSEPASLPGEPPVPIAQCDRLDVGGQLLRVCGELERLTSGGGDLANAVARLESQPAEFHAEIVAALRRALGAPENAVRCPL